MSKSLLAHLARVSVCVVRTDIKEALEREGRRRRERERKRTWSEKEERMEGR